ncbi:F-box/FBD/LRR-repeat protein At1g13570-like isoform X3 [Rhododendron vialii]|uniref:F-box/FBD/LRR-repeat protein At1g13570-like isoform X3 n=1 Tax=Rhododendron vialii TaxID=182163 RepID=UPI00265EB13B|nr:F-box/FBD/LRR-repeat protein At1g13570-like isoform X3 [Rhododendron vialii]
MKKTSSSRMAPKKRNTCDSNSDIISHVPGNILEKILMCLPIQDLVRTSLLSRKWRYVWMKLPQLVFDTTFYGVLDGRTHAELLMIIYQVLLLHHGPLTKFRLSLSELESCPQIDQLILFVSNNDIQDFTLCFWKGELYKLPSSLYLCSQLKHLNLRSCMLKPPSGFEGFTRLLSLVLKEVVIAEDVLSSLISSCPLLEELALYSSTSLDSLEVNGPNLKKVRCDGHFRSICFTNTSRLANVEIYSKGVREDPFRSEEEISSSVMLLESVPVIESLGLDFCYVKAFTGATSASPTVLDFSEVHGCSDVSVNQLRRVDMKNISGTKPELEFIKLLLAKSPMLDTMLIELNSESVADELRIVKELTRLRRASPQAEMNFVHQDED